MNANSCLWVIHGNQPSVWSVPFRVRWENNQAVLTAALYLNVTQARAVGEKMAQFATREGGSWATSYTKLKANGSPVPEDGNPEEYFGWERMKSPEQHRFKPEVVDPDRKAFLDWVYQQGMLSPFALRRPEVEYVWNQFCKAALHWIINEERPVDLYFVKLHNWPWRLDWKEKIRRHTTEYGFPRNDMQMKRGVAPTPEQIAGSERLKFEATSGLMSHMIDSFICSRFIEVEHTRGWWRTIKRVEQERWKMLKAEGYAKVFIESFQRQWPQFVRLLHAWMANSLHPSARVVESSRGCRYRLVPRLRGLRISSKASSDFRLAAKAAAHALRGRKRQEFKGKGKAAILLKLPAVSKRQKYVRESGEPLLES